MTTNVLLARLAPAGTQCRAPEAMDEAMDEALRDLVRAREDSVRERRNARHRLKALLLRNGVVYAARARGRQRICAGWPP